MPERRLPKEVVKRASLRRNEYAWRIADIPNVIEAARETGLVNLGGQLQFRLPDDSICECYWVALDTSGSASEALPWADRVAQSANVALADFARLASEYDFLEEGRQSFGAHLKKFEEQGGDPAEMMYFVWYLLDAEEAK